LLEEMVNYVALGSKVRTIRLQTGMSQEKLGELCQLSTAFIGHIERGTRKLSVDTLVRIASALQVSTDFLLSDSLEGRENRIAAMEGLLASQEEAQIKKLMKVMQILAEHADEL
jgi:transcriptional regulator with XRE-family HTH domain